MLSMRLGKPTRAASCASVPSSDRLQTLMLMLAERSFRRLDAPEKLRQEFP